MLCGVIFIITTLLQNLSYLQHILMFLLKLWDLTHPSVADLNTGWE